jgi:hypothetical protein
VLLVPHALRFDKVAFKFFDLFIEVLILGREYDIACIDVLDMHPVTPLRRADVESKEKKKSIETKITIIRKRTNEQTNKHNTHTNAQTARHTYTEGQHTYKFIQAYKTTNRTPTSAYADYGIALMDPVS